MKTKTSVISQQPVEQLIRIIRGQRVILDSDLALVYGVPTRQLNQAVKRNPDRFPADFAFQLEPQEHELMRSQIVTASKRNIRYRPWPFTQHSVIMEATGRKLR